ncbi:MAG: hypothetical protein ACFFAH_13510 [Promethearchaeota archaeon]
MRSIQIHCPTCKKSFTIEIREDILKDNTRGIFAINIDNSPEKRCSHSFVAYIDKNFTIRDYLITDFKLQLPVMKELEPKKERGKLPDKDLIDVYLLSINLNSLLLTSVITACFHKKKILILWDRDFLETHILNFFNFIFKDTFEVDISLKKRKKYEKNKKLFKDYIIIDNERVINDKSGILKPKTVKIEQIIIQKFLAEYDPKLSLILIKNEIRKAYKLTRELIEYNNSLKETEELTSKRILNYFQTVRGIKMQFEYLNFLKEIAKNYFEVELTISSEVSNFFGY